MLNLFTVCSFPYSYIELASLAHLWFVSPVSACSSPSPVKAVDQKRGHESLVSNKRAFPPMLNPAAVATRPHGPPYSSCIAAAIGQLNHAAALVMCSRNQK